MPGGIRAFFLLQMEEQTVRRPGSSEDTLPTPEDFPEGYDYGTGRIGDWDFSANYRRLPEPEENLTVLSAEPDTSRIQALYLWEEGNVPAQTVEPENMAGYFLRPYTQEEGALDVARAVRFIRKNADAYGIDPDDIAVMGYSAGGIQAGDFFLHYDGAVNGTALDPDYVPDELDAVPAEASACGMIYSFYGRLSVASMDEEALRAGDLPPTFYCYGTEDPFYRQFEAQYDLMQRIGVSTRRIVLEDWPHGFGGDGGWVEDYAAWLEEVFA